MKFQKSERRALPLLITQRQLSIAEKVKEALDSLVEVVLFRDQTQHQVPFLGEVIKMSRMDNDSLVLKQRNRKLVI